MDWKDIFAEIGIKLKLVDPKKVKNAQHSSGTTLRK